MSDDDEARRERARQRALGMTARLVGAGAQAPAEERLDPEVALTLATRLSRMSWSLSGRPFPAYERKDIPIRFVRRGET